MSNIEYERTIQIKYEHDDEITNGNMRKLAAELQKRGITLRDKWSNNPTYGFQERVVDTTVYNVYLDNSLLFTTKKYYVAEEVKNAINEQANLSEGDEPCYSVEMDGVKRFKEWKRVQGNYIQLDELVDDNSADYSMGKHCMNDDISIEGQIYNGYSYLLLTIKTSWLTDSIKRSDEIEDMLVTKQLGVVGKMQKIFESAIKLKKWGYDVNDVEIDCNFKAMTQNESKCSPDIIKMTRDARKAS